MKKFNPLTLCALTAVVALMAMFAGGCNTNGCIDNRSSIPVAGFYSMETGGEIAIDSISVGGIGAPDDSLLVNVGTRVQKVYLPFSSEAEEVSFAILYDWKNAPQPDLLTFRYQTIPFFVSEECGAMYRYRITEYSHTSHLLDSVAVIDSLITNVDRVTIKLFYHTETPAAE